MLFTVSINHAAPAESIRIDVRNVAAVKTLLDAGANIEKSGNLRFNICSHIFPEGEGADENAKKFKEHLDGGAEILRMLQEAGIDVPVSENENITYTRLAHSIHILGRIKPPMGYVKIVGSLRTFSRVSPLALKHLIETGFDVNECGIGEYTIMHGIACYYADYFKPDEMLQLLINSGANVNARDNDGVTPIMLIAYNILATPRAVRAFKILLEHGADFHAKDSKGRSFFDWLNGDTYEGKLEKTIWEKIIELMGGAYVMKDGKRRAMKMTTADLFVASACGSIDDIKSALERGANVDAKIRAGVTPLMVASVFNTAEVVRFLINQGARI